MTILKYEPLSDNLSIGELAKYDSKVNILETFRLIDQSPALFANIIPKEEGMLLAGLLECNQDEYVTCPADDSEFLMLQKLHLVITYEKKGIWHLYMTDKIRNRLNRMLEEDRKLYPEIEKMHNLLAQIEEKRDRLYYLLGTNNPDTLSKKKAKELSVEVEAIAKFFEEVKPKLKKVEKYLNENTDTKLDAIWQDIQTTEMYIAIVKSEIDCRA